MMFLFILKKVEKLMTINNLSEQD